MVCFHLLLARIWDRKFRHLMRYLWTFSFRRVGIRLNVTKLYFFYSRTSKPFIRYIRMILSSLIDKIARFGTRNAQFDLLAARLQRLRRRCEFRARFVQQKRLRTTSDGRSKFPDQHDHIHHLHEPLRSTQFIRRRDLVSYELHFRITYYCFFFSASMFIVSCRTAIFLL